MICSSQSGQIGRLAGNTDGELLKHKAPATYRSLLSSTMPTSTTVPRMHSGLNAHATSLTIMARFHSALYATSQNICSETHCSISLWAFHNCPEYLHIDSPLYFTPLSSQPNASPTLWTECCKQGWVDLPGQTCWWECYQLRWQRWSPAWTWGWSVAQTSAHTPNRSHGQRAHKLLEQVFLKGGGGGGGF